MDFSEKFLYHIWDAGHLKHSLRTVSGKNLKVVYQGQLNTNRGPDFSNVIVEMDGMAVLGTVEIHLNTSDWLAHNHQEDHFYNSVILHVVLKHNQNQDYTIREDGELTEILEIQDQLSEDIQKLLTEHDTGHSGPINQYCDLLSAIETSSLLSTLSIYGKLRFRAKVRRFNANLGLSNFDQIIYEGMMEAMGYDKNKLNFLALAQAIPIKSIKTWIDEGLSLPGLISILAINSGLWQKCSKQIDPETGLSIVNAYEQQAFSSKRVDIDWQLFRIRPGNHPIYRLITMASILYVHSSPGLLNSVLKALEDHPDTKSGLKAFMEMFKRLDRGDFGELPKPGKGLLASMYLNIILPIFYLYFEKTSQSDRRDVIMQEYQNFPGLEENHITRFMHQHTNQNQRKLLSGKAILQQGLIELYNRHCKYHLCAECGRHWQEIEAI